MKISEVQAELDIIKGHLGDVDVLVMSPSPAPLFTPVKGIGLSKGEAIEEDGTTHTHPAAVITII